MQVISGCGDVVYAFVWRDPFGGVRDDILEVWDGLGGGLCLGRFDDWQRYFAPTIPACCLIGADREQAFKLGSAHNFLKSMPVQPGATPPSTFTGPTDLNGDMLLWILTDPTER